MPNPDSGLRRRKVVAALSSGARWICYFAIFLILLLPLPVIYEVIADQLGRPPIWVFEITGYVIIMIGFAASGYGLSTGHHFRINLISEHFPRLAKPLDFLSALLETAFGIILLIAGAMQAFSAFAQDLRSDTLLQIPQGWPLLAFPVGGLAITLQGLAHLMGRAQARAAQ